MFHVCEKPMSGKRSETVRFDLESVVTRRYDRREMAAAMAACKGIRLVLVDFALPLLLASSFASPTGWGRGARPHLAVNDGVLSKQDDLSRRRYHESRHHGAGDLAASVLVCVPRFLGLAVAIDRRPIPAPATVGSVHPAGLRTICISPMCLPDLRRPLGESRV